MKRKMKKEVNASRRKIERMRAKKRLDWFDYHFVLDETISAINIEFWRHRHQEKRKIDNKMPDRMIWED